MTRADVVVLVGLAAQLLGLAARLADAGATDPAEMLSEAAAALIAGCSVRTLKAARRSGDLPVYGSQRSRTIKRSDLDTWIESRRAPVVACVDDVDMDRRMRRLSKPGVRKAGGRK